MATTERTVFTLLATLLLFFLLSFDERFAITFLFFTVVNVLFYLLDMNVSFRIEKPGNSKLATAFWALGGVAVFTIISPIILNFAKIATEGLSSIELYSQIIPFFSEITPALVDNPILIFLGFAVLVPIAETIFFNGRLYEGLTDQFSINTSTFNFRHILIAFGIVPAVATAFHFTVRGITETATPGLVLTFIFFAISQFIVIKRRQIIDAIGMHVGINATAIIARLGTSALSPIVIPVLSIIGFIILLRTKFVQSITTRF